MAPCQIGVIIAIFVINVVFIVISWKESLDYVHIWYNNQPQGLGECKIYLGTVPNLAFISIIA